MSALRRVRKSDNNRIARAVGATVVNRVEDLRAADVGTKCGLFNIEKIGDECVVPCPPPLTCRAADASMRARTYTDTSRSWTNAQRRKHARSSSAGLQKIF